MSVMNLIRPLKRPMADSWRFVRSVRRGFLFGGWVDVGEPKRGNMAEINLGAQYMVSFVLDDLHMNIYVDFYIMILRNHP